MNAILLHCNIYLIIFSTVFGEPLKCYYCDRTSNSESCFNETVLTNEETCEVDGSSCISSYIESTSKDGSFTSGFYRGCYTSENKQYDACSNYRREFEESPTLNLISCSSCTTNLCNKDIIRSAPLRCYNCDIENDPDRCISPSQLISPTEEECRSSDGSADNYVCISSYLNHYTDETKNGIYRGCLSTTNVADACNVYKEKLHKLNFNTTDCVSCTDNLCNNHTLLEDPLECYSCDVEKNFDECSEIYDTTEKTTCDGNKKVYSCISAYVKISESVKKSKIYRGCHSVNEDDPCELFEKQYINNGFDVAHCYFCNEKYCNTDKFINEDEGDDDGNSSGVINFTCNIFLIVFVLFIKFHM